jgi:hypothetical protein
MIAYHKFLTHRLPERDEEPLAEIDASEATPENVRFHSVKVIVFHYLFVACVAC